MAIAFCICCLAICDAVKFIVSKYYDFKKYDKHNNEFQEWLKDD